MYGHTVLPAETSSSVRDGCILWSPSKPEQADVVAALNKAAAAAAGDGGKPGGLDRLLDQLQRSSRGGK